MNGIVRIWPALSLLLPILAGCGRDMAEIRTLADAREARIGTMTGSAGEALAVE